MVPLIAIPPLAIILASLVLSKLFGARFPFAMVANSSGTVATDFSRRGLLRDGYAHPDPRKL
ncbi:hypothetical protein [Croceicoccus naphthovorans]|uniref:hypothetical protein n=1 Tax=Croceicoccus naphthovorans TaxID=1348774 RepID=UPI0012E06A6C|nr:hypothetical protein [Croceicoccus naphthovorans]MBB3989055.1 hypothetical protein [Croceicoccus naphthovorans]